MGTKKTLIILPGWGGSAETWKPFLERAKNDYHIVCVNLPCFGDEPCPKHAWGVEEYAEFALKKIQPYLLDKPILLGHSFGGQIATQVAVNHQEKFSALILVGAAVIRPKRPLRRFFFFCVSKIGKKFFGLPIVERKSAWAKHLLYRLTGSQDYASAPEMKREIFRRIIRQDLRKALPYIHIPTLVLWGTKDAFTPLRYGKKIAKTIPKATLDIVDGGKHGLHIQDPKQFLQRINAFTASLSL